MGSILDLTFNSTPADVAAVNLNNCHPLTGAVYIEGAKRGDAIAVAVVDIAPDDFGTTTMVPDFDSYEMCFPDPYIVHWKLNRLEARSKGHPGNRGSYECFHRHRWCAPGQARTRQVAEAGAGTG